MQGKNLRIVNKGEGKTPSERHLLGSSYGALEDKEHMIKSKLSVLRGLKDGNWCSIRTHLNHRYPLIQNQFSQVDSEAFTLTGNLEAFELW